MPSTFATAAVAKARTAVEALLKSRRAAEAPRVGLARFKKEIRATLRKYRPSVEEYGVLLDAYPEFNDAAVKNR